MKKDFNEELRLLEKLLEERDIMGTEQERKECDLLFTIAKLIHAENRRIEFLGETYPYDFSTFLSGILTERLQTHLGKTSEDRYELRLYDTVLRREAAAAEIEISELGSILIQGFHFC